MRKNSSTSGCSALAAKNWRIRGVCWFGGHRIADGRGRGRRSVPGRVAAVGAAAGEARRTPSPGGRRELAELCCTAALPFSGSSMPYASDRVCPSGPVAAGAGSPSRRKRGTAVASDGMPFHPSREGDTMVSCKPQRRSACQPLCSRRSCRCRSSAGREAQEAPRPPPTDGRGRPDHARDHDGHRAEARRGDAGRADRDHRVARATAAGHRRARHQGPAGAGAGPDRHQHPERSAAPPRASAASARSATTPAWSRRSAS